MALTSKRQAATQPYDNRLYLVGSTRFADLGFLETGTILTYDYSGALTDTTYTNVTHGNLFMFTEVCLDSFGDLYMVRGPVKVSNYQVAWQYGEYGSELDYHNGVLFMPNNSHILARYTTDGVKL